MNIDTFYDGESFAVNFFLESLKVLLGIKRKFLFHSLIAHKNPKEIKKESAKSVTRGVPVSNLILSITATAALLMINTTDLNLIKNVMKAKLDHKLRK